MTALKSVLLPVVIFTFNIIPQESNQIQHLLGSWIFESYGEETRIYQKTSQIPPDKGAYTFLKDGSLIVRQNVGWCGTPPITYGNYEGTWKMTSDSTLIIKYPFWGGTTQQQLQITSLDEHQLAFKTISRKTIRPDEAEH